MKSLKPGVNLKKATWDKEARFQSSDEAILLNFLLGGDKGFSVEEMFALLKEARLGFIGMRSPLDWRLKSLFGVPNHVLAILGITDAKLSAEQQLQLFELFHPVNRLLDFWCGHPRDPSGNMSSANEARNFLIHLHPQLRSERGGRELAKAAKSNLGINLRQLLGKAAGQIDWLGREITAILLSLHGGAKTLSQLAEHYLRICPVNLVTLEAISIENAAMTLKEKLAPLEEAALVMYESL